MNGALNQRPHDWATLAAGIQRNDSPAVQELYEMFGQRRFLRAYICGQLGPHDLEDRIHETFLAVLKSIQVGVREPDRLAGFIHTVVRRQVFAFIENKQFARRTVAPERARLIDRRRNPEQLLERRERAALMRQVLASMAPEDEDVLTSFYLREETRERICNRMELDSTQFRLLKSRAKARFAALAQMRFTPTASGARLRCN